MDNRPIDVLNDDDDTLDWSREKQLVFYVIHNEHIQLAFEMTPSGHRSFQRLVDSGFKPTDYEYQYILAELKERRKDKIKRLRGD